MIEKISPMMKHYLETKEKYPNCILFYRLGDFYEMFFDDAIKVSKLLDLTLTGKDCGLSERAPMCGIPFHASENYISKLVSMGEKVAVCEQLSEPNGKNLVERDVIKIVTAGTVTNNELIDERKNNFLGSIYISKNSASFSWVDITTGEFFTQNFDGEKYLSLLCDCLVKIAPVEIIGNSKAFEMFKESPLVEHGVLPKVNSYLESEFNDINAFSVLLKQLNVNSLSHFGLEDEEGCVCASGALISYLKETQKHALSNICSIRKISDQNFMMLDSNAIRNLELIKTIRDGKSYGTLLWLLDKTKTSMGARKFASWILNPLYDIDKINYRLNAVNAFFSNTTIREGISNVLFGVKDIGRITGKLSNGNLNPKDCVVLKNSLSALPNIKFQLNAVSSQYLSDIDKNLFDFSDLISLLDSGIKEVLPTNFSEGGYIKDGFNSELDELRKYNKGGRTLINEIESREREKTGIKNLKISYNRVFGYYIEVTNSFKELVPYEYQRRQTLAGAERYTKDELKELEEKILSSEDKIIKLENDIFNGIKKVLSSKMEKLQSTANALAELDVLLSLAVVARENDYVMPTIVNSGEALDIVEGRHPVVEAISKQRFVPNDCYLDKLDNRTMVITGPNMAGKSTYMRQVALITLMAHIGSFVPAKSAQIPLTDKIFTRVGASDSLILDQSTFMVEMSEVAEIMNNATENSLLILDEIGRGTSTYDGLSIAWAIVEYITSKLKAKTLFATHYHELTELEGSLDGVKNYKITVKELPTGIVFLRKIMRGGANKSFGIEVAELAGVPKQITENAKVILKKLENSNISNSKNKTENNIENIKENKSEVESIICDLDVNNMSPIQAFNILLDLSEKVKNKYE